MWTYRLRSGLSEEWLQVSTLKELQHYEARVFLKTDADEPYDIRMVEFAAKVWKGTV